MKKLPVLLTVASVFLLNGCLAERIENEERLKDDESSYRQCLIEHTDDSSKCDALKQLYDEDSKNLTTF
jgi:hypothetical protein